jgi:hypothetical protein
MVRIRRKVPSVHLKKLRLRGWMVRPLTRKRRTETAQMKAEPTDRTSPR